MDAVKEYTQIQEKLESAKQQKDKAEGALGQIMNRLKKEFDCPTLVAAKNKLKKLRGQKETAEQTRDKAVKTFRKDWPDELGED